MKLKLNYELNISQQNESLIPIIASIMGWKQLQNIEAVPAVPPVLDEEGNEITPGIPEIPEFIAPTPIEYLSDRVQKDIKDYFRNRVEEAHRLYTGLSGESTRKVLINDLQSNSVCEVAFEPNA